MENKETDITFFSADAITVSPQIKWATSGELLWELSIGAKVPLTVLDLKKAVKGSWEELSIYRMQLYLQNRRLEDEEIITMKKDECAPSLQCILVPLRAPTVQEGMDLHNAICRHDIGEIVSCLQRGLDPSALIKVAGGYSHNVLASSLTTDIFTPAHKDHKEEMQLTKMMIEAKANVNKSDSEGSTPLIFAIQSNLLRGVETLLQARADPHLRHLKKGASPLYYAASAASANKSHELTPERAMDGEATGAAGSSTQTTEVVVTQLRGAVAVRDYSLATTLGELVRNARISATNTTVVERIEVQLGPSDHLLTTEEQNLLGSAIMQIYEERLMAKGDHLTTQEVREQSESVREGVYNFMNSFTAKELVEMSQYAQLQDEEPAPMS
eukprot:s455_g9.t1